jgi:hypothetical protein
MIRSFTLSLGILASSVLMLAFGQTQQQSVRSSLTTLKTLTAWKAATPILPIPDLNLERSQLYMVSLKLQNTKTDLGLLMGASTKNPFVHYVSVIYGGAAVRDAGYAHGYLTNLVAQTCMGLSNATLTRVRAMMSGVMAKLKFARVTDTLREGALRVEASAEFKDNRLSVTMTLERSDAPGKAWSGYCAFEK